MTGTDQERTTMSADWLSTGISELLNSPHISFPKPPTGIRLGPGPIDLFSTKFNNLFALGVEAKVDGEEVSRDDLKQKLLNLQKHWKPEQVKFQQETLPAPVSRRSCNSHRQVGLIR